MKLCKTCEEYSCGAQGTDAISEGCGKGEEMTGEELIKENAALVEENKKLKAELAEMKIERRLKREIAYRNGVIYALKLVLGIDGLEEEE